VSRSGTTIWDGTRVQVAPTFTWAGRVANSPPNNIGPFGNFILDTNAQNFNATVTRLMGAAHGEGRLLLLPEHAAAR
jgi:hypothetical protein